MKYLLFSSIFLSGCSYIINIGIGVDQTANAVLLGDPDETISGRLGKSDHPLAKTFCAIIDPLFYYVDTYRFGKEGADLNHCIAWIEDDEG